MGVKAPGTRVAITATDKTGVFAEITQIFASYGIDIRNISNFNENGKLEMVVKVRSFDVDKAVEDIKAKGYTIDSITYVR